MSLERDLLAPRADVELVAEAVREWTSAQLTAVLTSPAPLSPIERRGLILARERRLGGRRL